jgi:hypothetical protein
MFRKHLGWYVEGGPHPADTAERRREKARLCRLEHASEIVQELSLLWRDDAERLAA